MLNIRYYLGYVEPNVAVVPSLRKIASLDMDLYESEHVWLRVFFANHVVDYQDDVGFLELLKKGDGRPFAAVPSEETGKHNQLIALVRSSPSAVSRQVTPAHDYFLTSNNTSFKVTAPGPGVVVLTEAFVPEDFQVRINGKPANYFRVNSAFKGVFVQGPGDYVVSFAYWPMYLTLSLWIAGAGAAILLGWVSFLLKRERSFPAAARAAT